MKQNSVELTSLVKMALSMQQQITIVACAITYANDRPAARRARREFNVALQPSTVGKWRKRLLEILDETVNGDRYSDKLRQIVLPVMQSA